MAFNLFGPLHLDPDLAVALLDPLLPGGVTEATVDIELAPDRKTHLTTRRHSSSSSTTRPEAVPRRSRRSKRSSPNPFPRRSTTPTTTERSRRSRRHGSTQSIPSLRGRPGTRSGETISSSRRSANNRASTTSSGPPSSCTTHSTNGVRSLVRPTAHFSPNPATPSTCSISTRSSRRGDRSLPAARMKRGSTTSPTGISTSSSAKQLGTPFRDWLVTNGPGQPALDVAGTGRTHTVAVRDHVASATTRGTAAFRGCRTPVPVRRIGSATLATVG